MKYLIIFLLCLSCGNRKTELSKVSFKSDSLSVNNSRILKQNIILKDIYQILPFDPLKPLIIDGKSYFNASITYDKSQFNSFEIAEIHKKIQILQEEELKKKVVEKKDYTILYALIVFIIAAFGFLLIYLPKIKATK